MYSNQISSGYSIFGTESVNQTQNRYTQKTEALSTMPSSWGKDTVSISAEAMQKLNEAYGPVDNYGPATGSSKTALTPELYNLQQEECARLTSLTNEAPCSININGSNININEKLLDIARTDFGAYVELIGKMQSGVGDQVLEALEEITGESAADISKSIAQMDDDEFEVFAANLAKLTGADINKMTSALEEIKEKYLEEINN